MCYFGHKDTKKVRHERMKSKKIEFEERKMLDSGHLKAIMPLFVRKYTFFF